MIHLKIYRAFFRGARAFQNGYTIKPSGLQIHTTGAKNSQLRRYCGPNTVFADGKVLGKNQYNNHSNQQSAGVCASAYLGALQDGTPAILQALPWTTQPWTSGSGKNGNANKTMPSIQWCQGSDNNAEYFAAAWDLYTSWAAFMAVTYDISVKNILGHYQLYQLGLASDHSDPKGYFKAFGKTMDDFRQQVLAKIKQGVQVQYIDQLLTPVKYVGSSSSSYLNLRRGPQSDAAAVAKIPNGAEFLAVNSNDTWVQAKYGDSIGYVMKKFCTFLQEQNQQPQKPQIVTPKKQKTVEQRLQIIQEALKKGGLL